MQPDRSLVILTAVLMAALAASALSKTVGGDDDVKILPIGPGWADTSINSVIFRHGPLATFGETQYVAYYNPEGKVVLGKRTLGSPHWDLRTTQYSGNARDAHNTISIAVDGNGILHMAWDHHNNDLNYVQSVAPGSLQLTDRLATDGNREHSVTYPEFYSLADGDLLLTYRVGSSGNGDILLKRYSVKNKTWSTLQANLITGKSARGNYTQNAYTEMNVDIQGTLHLGWVWRRTPDVATNHDICYARSTDGGTTWTDSTGTPLALPINDATCEVAVPIPENSDLINQTTLAADDDGHPYIATYFKKSAGSVAQLEVVYNTGAGWKMSQVGERHTPLNLGGGGTKAIPLSRPLVLVDSGSRPHVHVIFRDADRGSRVTIATANDLSANDWDCRDLTTDAYGYWEPTYDANLWHRDGIIDLFLQNVDQQNGSDNLQRAGNATQSMTHVLEWRPVKFQAMR